MYSSSSSSLNLISGLNPIYWRTVLRWRSVRDLPLRNTASKNSPLMLVFIEGREWTCSRVPLWSMKDSLSRDSVCKESIKAEVILLRSSIDPSGGEFLLLDIFFPLLVGEEVNSALGGLPLGEGQLIGVAS